MGDGGFNPRTPFKNIIEAKIFHVRTRVGTLKGSQAGSGAEYSSSPRAYISLSRPPPSGDLGAKSLHGTQCDFFDFCFMLGFAI